MKGFVLKVLWLAECLALGIWIAMMPMVIAGGIYEMATGSPSDGFFFSMIPWNLVMIPLLLLAVPLMCWKGGTPLRICRWLALGMFAVLVVLWCLKLAGVG